MGIPEEKIRKALKSFGGIGRRMEKKGEVNGILFLDDYAHHPTEVKTTLEGLRQAIGKKRLVCIFQPHRYSRTKNCLEDFGRMFDAVDLLLITDIFSAGEKPLPGLTRKQVAEAVKAGSSVEVLDIDRENLVDQLTKIVKTGDTVVTMGAGNITKINPELMEKIKCL